MKISFDRNYYESVNLENSQALIPMNRVIHKS